MKEREVKSIYAAKEEKCACERGELFWLAKSSADAEMYVTYSMLTLTMTSMITALFNFSTQFGEKSELITMLTMTKNHNRMKF